MVFPATSPAALPFWQRSFAQRWLPLLGSLGFHAALLLVAWSVYRPAAAGAPLDRQQLIIPESAMVSRAQVPPVPTAALGEDPKAVEVAAGALSSPPQQSSIANGSLIFSSLLSTPQRTAAIGVGVAAPVVEHSNARSGSLQAAPFGIPGGTANAAPRAPFMGISASATRIAFVCDASASMLGKFEDLRAQIQKSVQVLRPIQHFNVLFFGQSLEMFNQQGLVPADETNIARLAGFLENTNPQGLSDPIPALKIAFDQRPQLLYLLTDGDFPDNDAVYEYIAQRNAQVRAQVHTIAFVSRGQSYEKVLQRIAADNGGTFRYVSDRQLAR